MRARQVFAFDPARDHRGRRTVQHGHHLGRRPPQFQGLADLPHAQVRPARRAARDLLAEGPRAVVHVQTVGTRTKLLGNVEGQRAPTATAFALDQFDADLEDTTRFDAGVVDLHAADRRSPRSRLDANVDVHGFEARRTVAGSLQQLHRQRDFGDELLPGPRTEQRGLRAQLRGVGQVGLDRQMDLVVGAQLPAIGDRRLHGPAQQLRGEPTHAGEFEAIVLFVARGRAVDAQRQREGVGALAQSSRHTGPPVELQCADHLGGHGHLEADLSARNHGHHFGAGHRQAQRPGAEEGMAEGEHGVADALGHRSGGEQTRVAVDQQHRHGVARLQRAVGVEGDVAAAHGSCLHHGCAQHVLHALGERRRESARAPHQTATAGLGTRIDQFHRLVDPGFEVVGQPTHLLDRTDPGDGLTREAPGAGHGADQRAVDVHRAAAHALQHAGLLEAGPGKTREDGVAGRTPALHHAQDLDLEALAFGARQHGDTVAAVATFDGAGVGSEEQRHEEEDETEAAPRAHSPVPGSRRVMVSTCTSRIGRSLLGLTSRSPS